MGVQGRKKFVHAPVVVVAPDMGGLYSPICSRLVWRGGSLTAEFTRPACATSRPESEVHKVLPNSHPGHFLIFSAVQLFFFDETLYPNKIFLHTELYFGGI